MTAHNFIGPYCHGCGLFDKSLVDKPGYKTCELVVAAQKEREAAELAQVEAFCTTHPDGLYWIETHETTLTAGRLIKKHAPKIWFPLDGDESSQYHGLEIDDVTVIEGPIPPPAGYTYP